MTFYPPQKKKKKKKLNINYLIVQNATLKIEIEYSFHIPHYIHIYPRFKKYIFLLIP